MQIKCPKFNLVVKKQNPKCILASAFTFEVGQKEWRQQEERIALVVRLYCNLWGCCTFPEPLRKNEIVLYTQILKASVLVHKLTDCQNRLSDCLTDCQNLKSRDLLCFIVWIGKTDV